MLTIFSLIKKAGDRSFDFNYAVKGTLKRIIYPTGGASIFEYEPHLINGYNSRSIIRDTSEVKIANSTEFNERVISRDTWDCFQAYKYYTSGNLGRYSTPSQSN